MGCNILVQNNWCQAFTKDATFPFEMIDDSLSYFVEGYERTQSYKENKWDGRRHLFYEKPFGYSFRTGLLNKVLLILDVNNYPYHLTDDRKFLTPVMIEYEWNFNRPLWKHQEIALKVGLEKKSGVFEIGMGGGKTVLMAKLIHDIKNSANCFCERTIIAHQNERVFKAILGRCGFIGDEIFRPDKLNVIMLQTAYQAYIYTITADKTAKEVDVLPPNAQIYTKELVKISEGKRTVEKIEYHIYRAHTEFDTPIYKTIRDIIETTNVSFYDEFHHLASKTYYFVSMHTNSLYNFGLSATPYRMHGDDLALEAGVGQKIVRFGVRELIEQGILVLPQIELVSLPYIYFPQQATWNQVYRDGIVNSEIRTKRTIEQTKKWVNTHRIGIISIHQIRHGEHLTALLQDKGINAEFIYGDTPSIERDKVISKLQTRKLDVVVSNLLGEGFDLPELEFLIFAKGLGKDQPNRLSIMIIQESGRLFRPKKGKQTPILIDFIDRAKWLFDHFKARARTYKSFGCQLPLPDGIRIE